MTATLELFTTALSTSPVLADGGDGGRGLFTIYGPASAGGLLVYVITVIGLWGMFRKADRAGWLALIPIVNLWNTLRVAGRTGWMILLYLIPIVNIVVAAIIAFDLGRKFGRGGVFSFFLLFLFAPIGYLIVGLGGSRYNARA